MAYKRKYPPKDKPNFDNSNANPVTVEHLNVLRQLGAQALRSGEGSVAQFAEFVFRDNEGERITYARHHHFIQDWIDRKFKEGYRKIAIEAPIHSGKTQLVTQHRVLRDIGLNHRIRIKICSANSKIASDRLQAIRRTIESDEDYQQVFPDVKPEHNPGGKYSAWSQFALRIEGAPQGSTDATVQSGGVSTSIMGGRADLLLFDDPCDYSNSAMEGQRKRLIDTIQYQWLSRLSGRGYVIWIGTPFHREDAMATLTRTWQRLSLPVAMDYSCFEVKENGKKIAELPLWAGNKSYNWDAQKIKQFRKDYTQQLTDASFHLIPYAAGDALFKHFEQTIRWNSNPRNIEFDAIYGGIDWSTKTRAGTVIALIGITPDKKRIPIDIRILRDPTMVTTHMFDINATYGDKIQFVYAENNALQDALVDTLMHKNTGVPIRPWRTGMKKMHPYEGLPAMDAQFENNMWEYHIPHPEPFDDCPFCQLAHQITLFPNGNETDALMALYFAMEAGKAFGRAVFV